MTILVTGASGFLGRAFLRSAGVERIVGIDSVPFPDPLARNQETYIVDLLDRDAVAAIVGRVEPTKIVHLAALSSTGDGAGKIDQNLRMTWNLLRATRRHGRPHVVLAGSAAEYGETPFSPASEYRMPDPIDDYGLSKVATTMMGIAFSLEHDLPVAVLRFGNLYGPGQTRGFVPSVILAAMEGRAVRLNGRGRAVRPWLYVSDAVAALRRGLDAEGIYNVAEGNHTLWDVASAIAVTITDLAKTKGLAITAQLDPVDAPCGAEILAMDTARFRQSHNFRAVVPLSRGLFLTVAPHFEESA